MNSKSQLTSIFHPDFKSLPNKAKYSVPKKPKPKATRKLVAGEVTDLIQGSRLKLTPNASKVPICWCSAPANGLELNGPAMNCRIGIGSRAGSFARHLPDAAQPPSDPLLFSDYLCSRLPLTVITGYTSLNISVKAAIISALNLSISS